MSKSNNSGNNEENINNLKAEVKILSDHGNRMEEVIYSLNNLTNDMAKILSAHEEKHKTTEREIERILLSIKDEREDDNKNNKELHNRITTLERLIKESFQLALEKHSKNNELEFKNIDTRLKNLEKWRYAIGFTYVAIVAILMGLYKLIGALQLIQSLT